jgi:hypothetical protein
MTARLLRQLQVDSSWRHRHTGAVLIRLLVWLGVVLCCAVLCCAVLCVMQRQKDMIRRFRECELNVLVCTNIGSEGMDFRQCQVRCGS